MSCGRAKVLIPHRQEEVETVKTSKKKKNEEIQTQQGRPKVIYRLEYYQKRYR